MVRRMIEIDESRCTGCGLCAKACKESAIAIVDGKAKLIRDDYCDGLGNCLPACPADAIRFVRREAAPYNEAAVKLRQVALKAAEVHAGGCPGSRAREMQVRVSAETADVRESMLTNWPVQIKLLSARAPYLKGADLLIAADCTAYAYGDFHKDFVRGRKVAIGCTKLDGTDYSEKLTELFENNDIRSITVTRMEVPCCGGMVHAVRTAVVNSGKEIPLRVVTISADGAILSEEEL